MRLWIESIINSPSVYSDFLSWFDEIDSNLNRLLLVAVQEDNISKIKVIASEKTVYSQIRQAITKERRELDSQLTQTTK